MLKNSVFKFIIESLPFPPTKGQELLIGKLATFVTEPGAHKLLLVKGYAGTGKTSILSAFTKAMTHFNFRSQLLAPTGRAAKVFSLHAEKPALTVHKKIYRQRGSRDAFNSFGEDVNLHSRTTFIVDEASMIANESFDQSQFGSGRLLDDLIQFVYSGRYCQLIMVGDTAQLPPIGTTLSPAIDASRLEGYGLEVDEIELTEVVRQTQDSGILFNATYLRQLIRENWNGAFPKFNVTPFPDVLRITGEQLLEEIDSCYGRYGLEETIVVTRSNKRANLFCQGIRNSVLYREEEIAVGDLLMVVKNNYFWSQLFKELDFIANGDVAEIRRINGYEEIYGKRFADVTLGFSDYQEVELDAKILLDTLRVDGPALTLEANKELYNEILEDYPHLTTKRDRYLEMRKNPYYNALQVKFAYGVTCHKAQGGQWKAVFIDQGYLTEEQVNQEYLRWLYTAITRATEKLYFVNFPDAFFE